MTSYNKDYFAPRKGDDITIGLIDAIIVLSSTLNERLLLERNRHARVKNSDDFPNHSQQVIEALEALSVNEELVKLSRGFIVDEQMEKMLTIIKQSMKTQNQTVADCNGMELLKGEYMQLFVLGGV